MAPNEKKEYEHENSVENRLQEVTTRLKNPSAVSRYYKETQKVVAVHVIKACGGVEA